MRAHQQRWIIQAAVLLIGMLAVRAGLAQDMAGGPADSAAAVPPITADSIPVVPLRESPPPDLKPPEGAPQQLDDIVVTATKREKSAREVPVTINAMYGEDLEKIAAKDIRDYLALVPGITLQDGETGEVTTRNITIRGVGPGQGGNQTVGQFIGDVPMTDPYSNFITPDLDPYDLKSVEILKGPQGTYFGASALNGAIRYVPNTPALGEWQGRGFADYLSIEEGGAEASYGGAINVPVGDYFALRGMGVQQNTPGVIDNTQRETEDADSRRKWSARGSAFWQPLEQLDIQLMYLKQQSVADDVLSVDNSEQRLENNSRPGPSILRSGFSLAGIDTRFRFEDWGTLIWQTSYQTKGAYADIDSGVPASGSQGIETVRGFHESDISGYTHELRLVSQDRGRWSWIAGVFLLDYEADVETDLYAANTAALGPISGLPIIGDFLGPRGLSYGIVHTDPTAKETSAYGELSRELGEDWEMILGARLYKTHIGGTISYEGAASAAVPDFVVDQNDHGISPKLSLTYKPWAHVMTYATVSRGYQFGGVNASTSLLPFDNPITGSPPPPTFKSSSLWSRELGVRTDWFQRTLRFDFTVFDLDWKDAQFHQYIDNLVIDNDYIDNVGKVRSQGAETTLAWLTPIPGLSLNLAAAYTRAKTSAPYISNSGQETPAGTEMPATPRWQTATTLNYILPLGAWMNSAALVHTYSGPAYNNIAHQHVIYDYGQFNLNLSVARPDWSGAPSLTLGVTNLSDVRGAVGRGGDGGETVPGVTVSPLTYVYTRPRAISLRLALEF